MRSEGNDAVVDCDDPMTVIACTTNTDACPAACREADDKPVVVKAGDLYVTAKAAEGRRAKMPGVSDLDTLTFRTSEDVTINKVVLERYGYSSQDDVDAVWLEDQDGNVIADEKSLSKDKVTLSLKKDYRNVDGTYVATVVARLTGNNLGGTIGFKVVDADSTAKNLNLDDYTPYTYEMVSYTGSTITVNVKGTDKNYNYEEGESYELARFQAKAASAILYVKGFTLTNRLDRAVDMGEFLDKLTVKADGENVSGLKYSVNKDDQLVVSFDEITLDMNKSALFVVSASFSEFDDYGDGVAYYLASTSDLNAVEKKTGARVEVEGTVLSGAQAKVHYFNGGKIKLVNTKLGKVNAAQGAEGVVVAEGNITVTEPISKLGFSVTSNNQYVSALRMFVNGEEYEAKKSANTFTFSNVEIAESGKIQFKIDIEDNDNATGDVRLTNNFNRDDFDGAKYDNTRKYVATGDVSGSISFSDVTIQAAKAALKNNLTKDVDFLTETTDTKVVFDGTYTAKKALINLNKFYMSGTKSNKVDNIAYHLYIDGEEVAYTEAYGSGSEEIFDDVEVKAGASVKVRVEAEVEANTSTGSIDNVYVVLGGTDEFDKDVQYRAAKIMKINVKESGSVKIDAGESRNTVLRTASNANLATFTVKASDGDSSTKLDELRIELTLSGEDLGQDEVELLFDGGEEDDSCSYTDGVFTCRDLQLDLPAKVEVNLTVKRSGSYVTTIKSLNNKGQSRSFSKKYEEVLVKIDTQKKVGDETVFTLSIDDGDTDATVTEVQLYTASGAVTNLYKAGPIYDGEELRTTNSDKAQYITKIGYKWSNEDGTGTVLIEKNPYDDYFKVGGDVAKIFAND